MPTPIITTIIPTFQRPQWLKRAIESVLAQTFKDFKLCVYDNASGDETEAVVTEYSSRDSRVEYVKNSENIGAVNNMIRGVQSVTTEYYSLLNDDDFILPEFYQSAVREFERHPEAGFVCTKTLTADLANRRISFLNRGWRPGLYSPSIDTTSKMLHSHFSLPGVLFRNKIQHEIGPLEKSGSDILYMTIAASQSPFVVVDSYQAAFLIHPGSYSSTVGIANDDLTKLYISLIDTAGTVIKMNIKDDIKVHLLALVINEYFGIFEARKLWLLKQGRKDANASPIWSLPSRVSSAGLLNSFYSSAPESMHPVITTGIRAISGLDSLNRARKKRRRRTVIGRSIPFSADLDKFFQSYDSDVSKFLDSLRRAELPP